MIIPIWRMIRSIYREESYIWIDVLLIKETKKAILVMFDGRKTWIPKPWIIDIRHRSLRGCKAPEAISIKISEYHWAHKFQ